MSSLEQAAYVARLVDLLTEAKASLADEHYADLLVLAASIVAGSVADRIERDWMHQEGLEDG